MSIPWTEVWQWCDPTVSLLRTVENCSCHNIEGQFSPACQKRKSLLLILKLSDASYRNSTTEGNKLSTTFSSFLRFQDYWKFIHMHTHLKSQFHPVQAPKSKAKKHTLQSHKMLLFSRMSLTDPHCCFSMCHSSPSSQSCCLMSKFTTVAKYQFAWKYSSALAILSLKMQPRPQDPALGYTTLVEKKISKEGFKHVFSIKILRTVHTCYVSWLTNH